MPRTPRTRTPPSSCEGTEYVRCDVEEVMVSTSITGFSERFVCTYLDPETGRQEDVEMTVQGGGTTHFSPSTD
ncbi:hypothetical protein [Nocardiopsis composta]|uniref:Uncharacterized protein n=1 Tax=Nocardiopsis composta TaxID=157465 RepID=A0A7W8QJ51_9ACTN|nr:hypothetical protein [Nocardiopsis composta]MBB5430431.1 hypothetical protein [Nocardiopsis composta]